MTKRGTRSLGNLGEVSNPSTVAPKAFTPTMCFQGPCFEMSADHTCVELTCGSVHMDLSVCVCVLCVFLSLSRSLSL